MRREKPSITKYTGIVARTLGMFNGMVNGDSIVSFLVQK
jgi:hypothetical protein